MRGFAAVASIGRSLMALSLIAGVSGVGSQCARAQASSAQPTTEQTSNPLVLKRRIAIGRFSNSTLYGRALLLPDEQDPLADQAADMLATRLVESNKFIVLERRDLDAIKSEQAMTGGEVPVGADTILLGSVTQFGRRIEGKTGFLNSQARQVATATVEVRLVDTRTGQAFFSTQGSGTASVEVSEVAGFGSRAAYDSTLNDKAISAAISDLTTNLMQKLQERDWSSDILSVRGREVMISGGIREGLRVGDLLSVARRGPVVVSKQTGLPIELPSDPVAVIKITGFFGTGDAEGSTAEVVSGDIGPQASDLVVTSPSQ
jgi:curli biogenesis system outer membrane secretion channel CsgG